MEEETRPQRVPGPISSIIYGASLTFTAGGVSGPSETYAKYTQDGPEEDLLPTEREYVHRKLGLLIAK